MPATRRPHGQITRGKTALNRLRQVDVFVALAYPHVLRGGRPLVVDLGFGAQPWTTLEMRSRWSRCDPGLRVLGLEIDPERVAAAEPFAEPPVVDFRLGGFDLGAVLHAEKARVVRCYNVLRQYDEADVAAALAAMTPAIEPGGLLVEGTSDPSGRMVAFDVYRRIGEGPLVHDALVFGANFRGPLDPRDFQTIAPKRLIHRMRDPRPAAFFSDWRLAWELAGGAGHRSPRARWTAAASLMRERFSHPVDTRPRIAGRGFLSVADDLATPHPARGPADLTSGAGTNP